VPIRAQSTGACARKPLKEVTTVCSGRRVATAGGGQPSFFRLSARHAAVLCSSIALGRVRISQNRLRPSSKLLKPEATGVSFANNLPREARLQHPEFLYYYNGGGVGRSATSMATDYRPSIHVQPRLQQALSNKGNYQFEDITDRAGVADTAAGKRRRHDWLTSMG